MESKEANKVKIEVELVNNGAVLYYPELGCKFVVPGTDKDIAHEISHDIVQEMADHEKSKKFKVEIKISPI